MQLVSPSVQYEATFLEALEEYKDDPQRGLTEFSSLKPEEVRRNFAGYVQHLLDEEKGIGLPDGYVPCTTYWLVDDGEFIGRVSIRHRLTEQLLTEGGHIGYDIRPSKRQTGYGRLILALSLPKAKALGITKALVTCDENNIGSKKIIEANGGILENSVLLAPDKPRKLRYWIEL
jgi:predicted acetyltransferase